MGYASSCNVTYASKCMEYVIDRLKNYGIDPGKMKLELKWQTDNGKEFVGNVNARPGYRSAFQKVLDREEINHLRIPPRHSYLQGDVETFHKLVEDEFYDI